MSGPAATLKNRFTQTCYHLAGQTRRNVTVDDDTLALNITNVPDRAGRNLWPRRHKL
jgi:hypothetical protein